jgi:hypothetical protein
MKLSACAPTPRRAAIATLALLPLAGLLAAPLLAQADRAHVLELLREVPVIDGHNDVPWQYRSRAANHLARIDFRDTSGLEPAMHTDLARLARSGIGGQFWSVYIPAELDGPGAARAVLEQIDVVHRLAAAYPDRLAVATSADDIVRLHAQGKVASLIGMEGGHSIESSLAVLRQLHRAGARYMTLTHSENIAWADASTDDPAHGGLTEFGRQVVREMNRIGMLVDLSHVAASTMHDALDAHPRPGHLLALLGLRADRPSAQRPRRRAEAAARKRRRGDGHLRAALRQRDGARARRVGATGTRPPAPASRRAGGRAADGGVADRPPGAARHARRRRRPHRPRPCHRRGRPRRHRLGLRRHHRGAHRARGRLEDPRPVRRAAASRLHRRGGAEDRRGQPAAGDARGRAGLLEPLRRAAARRPDHRARRPPAEPTGGTGR